jgi:Mut7-C RNAse domain
VNVEPLLSRAYLRFYAELNDYLPRDRRQTTLDVAGELRVRPKALREPRFVLDAHLGILAGYLRMLGFDIANEFTGRDRITSGSSDG